MRVKFNPITAGVCCQDTILLLSAICKKLCVSDVFLQARRSDVEEGEELERFVKELDERQQLIEAKNPKPSESNESPEGHVLQALLLTVALRMFSSFFSTPSSHFILAFT